MSTSREIGLCFLASIAWPIVIGLFLLLLAAGYVSDLFRQLFWPRTCALL